jgi:DNA-3-methyladenine glycosylase I
MKTRCPWAGTDPLYIDYHDAEWGVPVYDDRKLFEFLALEGAQAGLSWITVLRKREQYRKAFDNFNPEAVARYGEEKIRSLLSDNGIIRNRLKINATVANARSFLQVQTEFSGFSNYIWRFIEGMPITNHWKSMEEIPAKTDLSETISRDLKKRGFRFVGPTICYAFMQATGMVNDHVIQCFRHDEIRQYL